MGYRRERRHLCFLAILLGLVEFPLHLLKEFFLKYSTAFFGGRQTSLHNLLCRVHVFERVAEEVSEACRTKVTSLTFLKLLHAKKFLAYLFCGSNIRCLTPLCKTTCALLNNPAAGPVFDAVPPAGLLLFRRGRRFVLHPLDIGGRFFRQSGASPCTGGRSKLYT